ncbi:MAG: RNA polymerase sigma factor RpoE, partial [uncultured Pseudonocardia sp.]
DPRADPARSGPRAARVVRPGAAAGVRVPARPLRPAGAGRGPDLGDVPGRGGRVPAHPAARAVHRLAHRGGPAQAGRPLAGGRARGARAARRRRHRAARPLGRGAPRRAARPPGPRRPVRDAPGGADAALPRRAAGARRRPDARAHRARRRGPALPRPGRVPAHLRPLRPRGRPRCL